ncbi:hypothetical protein HS088_TW18G00206 [Tripterygium wilfordii]|uniref:FAF domain-containing protein n=1 Tax=Tripterygium wilfordii TaxID=458696 RepID=A0A7J7CBL4_TRIWF|nr:protein FANTASTIC FOUR 3-like [Tripterygium wilfordii]KAF5731528.1 hypothetical protein HS088_TW18G00206 [Tripterygium wilfordii]
MSSSVCQGGLQSCLDFNFFNTPPLRPCLTDSEVHKEQNNMKSNDNIDMGGWSFLQSLNNSSEIKNKEAIENEKVYVHPLHTRSSSCKLSAKSLEMCTETLGSETGSNCSESSDEILFTSTLEQLENRESSPPKYYKNRVTEKRMKRSASFPPPLTSIRGTSGVQLRTHREGGRLVIKAESVSCCHTYFQAERSDGRLRLRLLQNCSPNFTRDEDEEGDVDTTETETREIEKEKTIVDVEETEETEKESSVKVKGEMGLKKLSMTSRCKESEHRRKGLLNWEPFCVAS